MKSHELADSLEKLAKHLREQPDEEIGGVELGNVYGSTSDQFKALAMIMPKPLTKRYDNGPISWLWLEGTYEKLKLSFHIDRSKVCRLVTPAQPAVYECDPLLSAEEEAALVTE